MTHVNVVLLVLYHVIVDIYFAMYYTQVLYVLKQL